MRSIAIVNQKGGTGKTTITTHLAVEFLLRKKEVLLIDSDSQGSLADWYAIREKNGSNLLPTFIQTNKGSEIRTLIKNNQNHNNLVILVDGTPAINEITISTCFSVDAVVIPITPSPLDIWASSQLLSLLENNQNKQFRAFLMNKIKSHTILTTETANALSKATIGTLEERIKDLQIYPKSMALGLTEIEMVKTNVWKNITDEIEKGIEHAKQN